MVIYRSNKRRFQARQAAQKSVKSQEKNRKKRKIQEINEQLEHMDYNKLDTTNKMIKKFDESTELEKKGMFYQKLNQKNTKLISKTKALGPIKRHSQNQKAHHISQIRSLVRKYSMSPDEFRKQIKMLFKIDNREYSSNTVWLAAKILQVGQNSIRSTTESMKLIYEFLVGEPPKHWFSNSTLATWHKDVSQIQVNELLSYAQKVSSYG
ncbi:11427_t:CDS:2, partial [Cetraspora pellucida]